MDLREVIRNRRKVLDVSLRSLGQPGRAIKIDGTFGKPLSFY